jgi:hypothetical protein
MKTALSICLLILLFYCCSKDHNKATSPTCNIEQVYADNAKKVTIANGVWGTVSLEEGNCMPSVPYAPCKIQRRPIKRTVKIYQYSTTNNTIPFNPYGPFFDSLNTQLVRQVNTDENGFFQADVPPGHYSIFIVENGKLYADNNKKDSQGGLHPFSFTSGTINVNPELYYVTF